MMFNEIKSGEIPCLTFLKGTRYAMYVGPELTLKQRDLLKSDDITIPVIYLPEIMEQLSEDIIKYNFPGVSMPEDLSAESIYAQIMAEFEGRITPESRLIIKYDRDALVIYDAKDSFSHVISYLINVCSPRGRKECARKKGISRVSYDSIRNWVEKIQEEVATHEALPLLEKVFDAEMKKALRDAEKMIQDLLIKGCPPEMLLSMINRSIKISRLKITKQFKIYLTDYDNLEVKMGPLPKTVFLFYLRHPEGVMFSHLQDHRDELLKIYSHVCTNDDPKRMEESIKHLTDPLDNSICEKCSNIRKAFAVKIADSIASNYYINGPQGEKKKISLDRNLVEWECELMI